MQNFEQTILSQYGNSPTIVQLVANMNTYIDPTQNIEQFYSLVWNVDTAVGYGLDVWGRIVGVTRVLAVATINYLGFIGPRGTSGEPFNQAVFYNGETTTSNFTLLDDPYRTLILAKALFNITDATIPSINQLLLNLFGPTGFLPIPGDNYVTDGGNNSQSPSNMSMTFQFGSDPPPVQKAIILQSGVLPRPTGVLANVNAFVTPGNNTFLGTLKRYKL